MNSIVVSCPIVSMETLGVCRERTPWDIDDGWWSTEVQPSKTDVVNKGEKEGGQFFFEKKIKITGRVVVWWIHHTPHVRPTCGTRTVSLTTSSLTWVNPIYVRTVDPSALAFSLSSHRHLHVGLLFNSRVPWKTPTPSHFLSVVLVLVSSTGSPVGVISYSKK